MRFVAVAVALSLVVVFLGMGDASLLAAASPLSIVVTSTADTVATPTCPDVARCTLRRAIEAANLDTAASDVVIRFSPTLFPPVSPATIMIGGTPLPIGTRADLAIDGSDAGVRIVGTLGAAGASADGLVLTGARARVSGLSLASFTGHCLKLTGLDTMIGGDRAAGKGNSVGNCATGIRSEGATSSVVGNRVGFADDGVAAAPVQTAVVITASNAVVGDDSMGAGYQNRIGNAQVGLLAGGSAGPGVTGIKVAGNVFGVSATGSSAPVGTAIRVLANVTSAFVSANTISNAQAGIAVQGAPVAASASGVRMTANTFNQIGRLSIDLDDDGIANPNDEGDPDVGANGLRNHPRFTRVVQARITGTACAGCQIQLYLAAHSPGGVADYGAASIPGAVVAAGADGSFSFDSPAVTPGEWVTALATDAQGNTSEFAPGSRVGAGSLQCSNGMLERGWNLVGYFSADAVNLGISFPAEGPDAGKVRAIYHLEAGSGVYTRWLADAPFASTLTALEPGEAYWFLADHTLALSGGFALSTPVPVQLRTGWNTLVYIGAAAPALDAFASLGATFTEIHAWDATSGAWSTFGAGGVPSWAQGFTEVQACHAYQLYVGADALLVPLQP
ncbi:MAG: CSLREA domain-containing protein [Tepidiformaceae bacterium]